jgi:hypothetical protein
MMDEQTRAAPEAQAAEAPVAETPATDEKLFTDEQFAHLGGGTICYVKPMRSEEVRRIYPNAPSIEPGLDIFALLGADGSPLILSDSRDAAVASAITSNLEMVSLH